MPPEVGMLVDGEGEEEEEEEEVVVEEEEEPTRLQHV